MHHYPILHCEQNMRFRLRTLMILLAGTSWVAIVATMCLALRISAEDEPGAPKSERDKRVQLLIDATPERYRLRPGAGAQTTLEPQVAIRWRNPTRGGQANA